MNIQTLAKYDNVNKRPFSEIVDMEVDEHSSSKRTKSTTTDKMIADIEEEDSINKGGHAVIIQEEQERSITNSKETNSQSSYKAQYSQSALEIQ